MIYGISFLSALYLLFKGPRLKRFPIQLKPNCLMTRFPIIFISGKQSFFYHRSYFNQIPIYLREHGYDVHELSGLSQLNKLNEPFHLVISEEDYIAQRARLDLIDDNIRTVSLLDSDLDNSNLQPFKAPLHYLNFENVDGGFWSTTLWKWHQIWTQSKVRGHQLGIPGWSEKSVCAKYLNHFQRVAERDWE